MTQYPVVKIPVERLDQLKAIGGALGLSIADTVGHLIRAEIARGTIPDAMPGVIIRRNKTSVRIQLDDQTPHTYGIEQAKGLAATIRDVVDGGYATMLNLDVDCLIERGGNGIKLRIPYASDVKIVSRDVARDIARLIDAAVDQKSL